MESPLRWNDTARLDDIFMSMAEGDASVVPQLENALKQAPKARLADWPDDTRESWETGLELALDGLQPQDLPAAHSFLLSLAAAGFDNMVLRDHLATIARSRFSDYLDPAGLLSAFGIHDMEVSTPELARRWQVFEALKPGCACYDPRQGIGRIEEIDDIANHVKIQYERVLDQPLDRVIGQIVLILPDSTMDRLLKEGEAILEELPTKGAGEELLNGVISAIPLDEEVLKAMMTPSPLSAEAFAAVFAAESAAETEEADEGPSREWHQSRSIYELVDLLQNLTDLGDLPDDMHNAIQLLKNTAGREDALDEFAEAVARLQALSRGADWFTAVLRDLGPEAQAWNDLDLFANVTDDLPGRLVLPWLTATATARSPKYLAEATLSLPLRLWSHTERILAEMGDEENLLLNTVVDAVESGNVPADALLWLYRQGGEPATLLANPPLLFKTLEKPVHGSYIKARKDLQKMLMDDQAFQRLIMKDGEPDAIASLVRMVRHASLLDSGERQSLLVKIVRVFPEAIELVEQKNRKLGKKAVGKITSIRTFHIRRRELEHIINVDVPANARAIAHARSYGDLRENAEYKAAKERQAYLTARRAELEEALHEIKPTDFRDVKPGEVVVPGSTVTVTDDDDQSTQYHIMGIWDSVPERHILSYQTPVGSALMGTQVGDRVTMPTGDDVTVTSVEALSEELLEWAAESQASAS